MSFTAGESYLTSGGHDSHSGAECRAKALSPRSGSAAFRTGTDWTHKASESPEGPQG